MKYKRKHGGRVWWHAMGETYATLCEIQEETWRKSVVTCYGGNISYTLWNTRGNMEGECGDMIWGEHKLHSVKYKTKHGGGECGDMLWGKHVTLCEIQEETWRESVVTCYCGKHKLHSVKYKMKHVITWRESVVTCYGGNIRYTLWNTRGNMEG